MKTDIANRNNWDFVRIKYLATYNDEALPDDTPLDFEFNYIEISDVNHINGITNTQELEYEKAPSRARRIVHNGDTIVSTVRTYLKAIAYIDDQYDNSIASTGFAVIRSKNKNKINPKYLSYCFQDNRLIGDIISYSNGVSYPAINASEIVRLSIYKPSFQEQTQIAQFLDNKTSQIDKLIEQKEKQLKLLTEKRTALITQAVTKGLDPTVEMKDSGVDWLGEIPKHWEVKRLKFLASSNDEKLNEDEDPDLELKYVEIGNVNLIDGITYIEEIKFENAPSRARRIARKGDIIISTVRTYLKAIAFIDENIENLIVSTGFAVLRTRNDNIFLSKYLGYCAQDQRFIEKIVSESVGVSYPAISPWKITEISVAYTDVKEQKKIAEFLDSKLYQLDNAQKQIISSINILKEYREALITSAVTGQIDVRKEFEIKNE